MTEVQKLKTRDKKARAIVEFSEHAVCERSQYALTVFSLADELVMLHTIQRISK